MRDEQRIGRQLAAVEEITDQIDELERLRWNEARVAQQAGASLRQIGRAARVGADTARRKLIAVTKSARPSSGETTTATR